MKNNMKYRDHSLHFKSKRGIYLVSNIPGVITVEDTNKWEDLYYINDTCEADELSEVFDKAQSLLYEEHFYPSTVVKFAIDNNLKIEYLSYAAICQMYIEDSGYFNVPEHFLPTEDNLRKVLIDGNETMPNLDINYCETFNLYPHHFTMNMCIEAYSRKKSEDKYSYALCNNSFGNFKEGEVFRVGFSSTPDESLMRILEEFDYGDNDGCYPDIDICSKELDNFSLIFNVGISDIDEIKNIFSTLQD